MRGLQQSFPSGDPPPPPPPPTPSHTSTTTVSNAQHTQSSPPPLSHFQSTVDHLQAQQTTLHHSLETLTSQVTTLQQSVMDTLQHLRPPSSPHPTTSSNLSFGSIPAISTTWTGLGLSNPPPPDPHPSSHAPTASSSTPQTTPPIYSTLMSIGSPSHNSLSFPLPNSSIPSTFASYIPQYTLPIGSGLSHPSSTTIPRSQPHYTFSTDPYAYKPPRVDLPRFNGDDVVGWLAMAERYLRLHRVPLHDCVPTVASHFGPDASIWMNSFEQRHPNPSWDRFVPALLEHFGSGNNSDFKAILSHLQQSTSVDDYISEFTKLSCRAPEWSDDQLLPIFCGGLKADIRHDVMALEPRSLASAQRLARRYEAKMADLRLARTQRATSWNHSHHSRAGPHSQPHSTAPTNIQNNSSFPSSSPHHYHVQVPPTPYLPKTQSSGPFRRCSPAEQRERRAKGLCFNCDEAYSASHVCKKPFMAILESPTPTPSNDTLEFHDCPPHI